MPQDTKNAIYVPRGGARSLFSCDSPQVLFEGPAGTGKTRAVLQKMHFTCLKYPGCRILALRKTRASMNESVLVTFEEKVLGEKERNVLRVNGGPSRAFRSKYVYPNGSSIVLGGMDSPIKIMSTEYDLIAAFEAVDLNENEWEMLQTRLRNNKTRYHQSIADCNPDAPTHWLNVRAEKNKMRRIRTTHEDNPTLWDGSKWTELGKKYIAVLDNLSGPRHARLRLGLWASSDGLVYQDYDPAIHVIDKAPDFVRRFRSIDFGFVNPFVCQLWGETADGCLVLYREYYKTGVRIGDASDVVSMLSEGESYDFTVTDHDAGDRATLEYGGIITIPANKSIIAGISAVRDRMRITNQGPRLKILRGYQHVVDGALKEKGLPVCLTDELLAYKYPPKGGEIPEKKSDHACDAMRYLVAAVDGIGRTKLEML